MADTLGTPIMWGNMPEAELPKLPDGWTYLLHKDHWVLAISPEHKFYYVTTNRLYPRRVRENTLTYYLDDKQGVIELPIKG